MVTFIAEIGNNHNGDLSIAKKMIDAAISTKADFIKFQVYNPEHFISKTSAYYSDFLKETLKFEHFRELKTHTEQQGGVFLATPFDSDSVDFLSDLGVTAVKISSGDARNWLLLEEVVRLNKKIFISVGGLSTEEIHEVVKFLDSKNCDFHILHCVISYPATFAELNLRFMSTLQREFGSRIGFSDHSPGIEASLAAIALGATVIEKHFTIDQSLPGGDNSMSILPDEFSRLIREGRNIEQALGTGQRILSASETQTKELIARYYFAKADIKKGERIDSKHLFLLRSSHEQNSIKSDEHFSLLGRRAKSDIKKNSQLFWSLFE